MNTPSLKIYQIYFQTRQIPFLSDKFFPYLNKNYDDFYESGVFRREFTNKTHLECAYTGFVSWKFERKSFVDADSFINLINEKPGKDVYFLNPFPELVEQHQNVWIQGDQSHAGLLTLAQKIFDHVGYTVNLRKIQNDESNTLYCNYWFGSKVFWNEFMAFSMPFYDLFEDRNSPFYDQIRASAKYHGGGTLIPFFMERLFSTFLVLREDISKHSYTWTHERQRSAVQKMRNQLNVCEAQLDEIRLQQERKPKWRNFLAGI